MWSQPLAATDSGADDAVCPITDMPVDHRMEKRLYRTLYSQAAPATRSRHAGY